MGHGKEASSALWRALLTFGTVFPLLLFLPSLSPLPRCPRVTWKPAASGADGWGCFGVLAGVGRRWLGAGLEEVSLSSRHGLG